MKKIILLWLSACWLLFAPALHAAGIAVISHANITPYRIAIEGFRAQIGLPLREYHLGVKNEHLDDVKQAIAAQKPELIFALGTSALSVSREINHGIPVIFAFVLHPENVHMPDFKTQHRESGIAMSIAAKKQFKTLLEIVPGIKNIGVVYDPDKSIALIQEARLAAKALNLNLVAMAVPNQNKAAQEIAETFAKVGAMWMVPDTTVLTSITLRQMIRLSLTHSVALIGLAPKYVRAGSLFSLSFDSRAIGIQAARMAVRMLKGRQLPELVSPDATKLAINRLTARRMGLKIPTRLLKSAAHIYPEMNGEKH